MSSSKESRALCDVDESAATTNMGQLFGFRFLRARCSVRVLRRVGATKMSASVSI